MSFTNRTTNYGLPQWIGTDKPTYLIDQNGAYATIDTELYNANSNATNALSSAASAVEVAGSAATNAQTAIDSAATANTNANNAVATANTAITNAATATATANSALGKVEDLENVIIDTHTFTSTTYADLLNTVGSAINNSIANYPFSDYEYTLNLTTSDDTEYQIRLDSFVDSLSLMLGMYNPSFAKIDKIRLHLTDTSSQWYEYDLTSNTFTARNTETVTNVTTKVYVRKR